MTLNLQEVALAISAAEHPPALPVGGWSVDTRTQNPGDVYFALRGPNHDGHKFLTAAAAGGASAVVVDHATGTSGELVVQDTERALQDLALWARQKWGGTVIGVTGS